MFILLLLVTHVDIASPEMIAEQNAKIREQALEKGKAKGINLDTAEKLMNADGTLNTAALEEDVCLKTFERLIEDPERLVQAVAHDRSAIESFLDVLRGIKNSLVIKFTGSEKAMLDEAERTMVNLLRGEAGTVDGERFSYVGEDAKLNDDERRALQEAKEKLAEGEDPEKIRQQTNWFIGADEKWRMEVDDSKAVYYPKGNARSIFPKRKGTVSDYLYHEDLQRLVPDIFKLPMKVDQTLDSEANGVYGGRQAGIRVREGAGKSTVLHEVQHGIQDYSGFARGSGTNKASKWALIISYDAFKDDPKYRSLRTSEERFAYIKDMAKYATPYHTWKDAVWNYYDNAAGEVEARDVARRVDYSDQKRTDTKPDTNGDPAFGNDPTLYFVDMLSEMGYSKEKIKQILEEGV